MTLQSHLISVACYWISWLNKVCVVIIPVVVDDDGRPRESVGAGLDESGGAGHELEVGLAHLHRHLTHLRVPAAEHVACTGVEHNIVKHVPSQDFLRESRY